MPTISDGAPENSAPADVTIAGPFDDGDEDFDDHGGVGMGTAEEVAAMSAMFGQMVKMEAMQAKTGQLQATQARRDRRAGAHGTSFSSLNLSSAARRLALYTRA